ncbi:TonB-dependent receptor domain-containing protein [Saccharicrinis sp. FJH54]|uniref:TonB-dependent receptor n=1 Tax=Saccharicrinis sp. FJH54 TaxID=3344665 RepID=UPI0035D4A668
MKRIVLLAVLSAGLNMAMAENTKASASIEGRVTSGENEIPFASVAVKGSTVGTLTDATGFYELEDLPVGELTIVTRIVGYKPQERTVITRPNEKIEIRFDLEEDVLDLHELVVSADRSAMKRTDAPVIVNTLSPKLFNTTQSVTLSESLNFCPGLRLENNCQNCGFTQVRMNGMEGPYSQILINSRPIFSGLAGVYGLELIPSNMIEKVEVVRGGGSALFGSNAIAGTINLILKDPVRNAYEVGSNYTMTGAGINGSGGAAQEYSLNFNSSLVSEDQRTGLAIYGFTRDRQMFDANGDGYSELAPMKNLTLGARVFQKLGFHNKVAIDFFTINENREGGNKQDYPLHERDVAEAVSHDLKTAAITYEQYFRQYDMLSVFASGQFLNRDSYYGANYSLSDYGNSKDRTYNIGAQYKAVFDHSSLVTGIENTGSYLVDQKLGYPDYANAVISGDSIVSVPHTENTTVSDQSSVTTGAFAQYELKLNRATVAVGARFDHYRIQDHAKADSEVKSGNVTSPRLSLMYKIINNLQARMSYSQGYRAPQIFDEDLHIETSGSRQVINVNDLNLKQETSHSVMASLDYNGMVGKVFTGLLLEGFYTRLQDPFVNEIGIPDETGRVVYTRKNAEDGAVVAGLNVEFKLRPAEDFSLTSGFTIQKSEYDVPQEFNETRFFRTPNHYGFFALDWDFAKNICLSATGNYTGKMLVPYFGPDTDPDLGELRISPAFFDFGAKISYTVQLKNARMEWLCGVKNVFNAYQSDFDLGKDRDPAYMYGPVTPRTVYVGVKFGNVL